MILNVITLLLVAAITFMHSIFGFFSGLINVFCTIVSLTVAFGFFEPLNDLVTANTGIPPTYCEPTCLIVLFLISFLILRTLADNYIRGNVRVPMAVDWGGAAVCGVINAQLIVGMMVIALNMLPVRDPTSMAVLGYGAYQRNPDFPNDDHPGLTRFDRNPLWTRSDEFTAGLFSYLSGGSLSGETAFASVYPDFAEAAFYSTNTVQPESATAPARGGRQGDGFKEGLKVDGWWEVDGPIDGRYRKFVPTAREPRPGYERREFEPAAGMKLICVDMTLRKAGGDRKKSSVMHLFRPTQLRLVGKAGNRYEHFVPVVLANADEVLKGAPRIVDLDNNFSISNGSARVYAYYEVPQDFQPTFVEYRRHARAALGSPEEEPGNIVLTMANEDEEKHEGRKRTFGSILEHSGDTTKLPFAISAAALRGAPDVTIDDGELVSGRIFGSVSRLTPDKDDAKVEDIKLPDGLRLLQVRYKPAEARTIVGDVFNFVGQLKQYQAEDSNGNRYPLVGYYAMGQHGTQEYIEFFFAGPENDPLRISYNGMMDFKEFTRAEINDAENTIVGLLFLVPPETEVRKIVDQTGKGGEVHLRARRG